MISAVAIDADAIKGVVVVTCEVRHDERDVTRCANHRMRSIRVALPRPIIRVGMHVGDHAQLPAETQIPQQNVTGALEHDYTSIERRGIEIVVAHIRGNIPPLW